MSWPKAFVKINGGVRTATVWGLTQRGRVVIDGAGVSMPMLAIEIEFPYGRPVDFDFATSSRYTYMVIPISDVCSVNWECLGMFERTHGIDVAWWHSHGVKCHVNGYGADVKQVDLNAQKKAAGIP